MRLLVLIVFILFGSMAKAECIPEPGGKCLTSQQFESVKKALSELDLIKKSPAVITTSDKIIIIHDWRGRVYLNGGDKKPLNFKLKIGETIDRDMAVKIDSEVHYRPKPPDPMFRLRIRAQFGILVPELVKKIKNGPEDFLDAGISWDFFHYKEANFSIYTGIRSLGAGIGYDITKNFGPYIGYAMTYDDFNSSLLAGVYFSIN